MADRPILFSAPMVRALLDGTKTQTRRLCQWANNPNSPALSRIVACDEPGWFGDEVGDVQFKVPFAIGDRLWVREAWTVGGIFTDCVETRYQAHERASHTVFVEQIPIARVGKPPKARWPKYSPSIHMPRWASRLTLTVTDVRVERLQDISEADAVAEGASTWIASYRLGYERLWNSINGPGAWEANPWVVAVSFTVGRHNIDRVHP